MRAVKVLVAAWLAVLLFAAVAVIGATRSDAHEEGAVAVCNWADFEQYGHDGYNWVWVRCNHTLHRHGYGYHPRRQLKAEARAFRAYCGID